MRGWEFNGEVCTKMTYKVWDSKRGHIFATEAEARAYCNHLLKTRGIIVLMTESQAKATHVWEV